MTAGRDDAPPALHGREFTIKTVDDQLVVVGASGPIRFEDEEGNEIGIGSPDVAYTAHNHTESGMASARAGAVAPSSVGTGELVDSAVTRRTIGPSAVGKGQLAHSAVDSEILAPSGVGTGRLSDSAVGTGKLGDSAVVASKVGPSAIGTNQLAPSSVTNDRLSAGAVDSAVIADSVVGKGRLAHSAVGSEILAPSAVGTERLADSGVTAAKIADSAVTSRKATFPTGIWERDATISVAGSGIHSLVLSAFYDRVGVFVHNFQNTASAQQDLYVRFNNDSGTNYEFISDSLVDNDQQAQLRFGNDVPTGGGGAGRLELDGRWPNNLAGEFVGWVGLSALEKVEGLWRFGYGGDGPLSSIQLFGHLESPVNVHADVVGYNTP